MTLRDPLAYDHVSVQHTFQDGSSISLSGEVGLLSHNVKVIGSVNDEWTSNIQACPDGFDTGEDNIAGVVVVVVVVVVMTKPLERKITACEMKCVRKAVNKTRRYMIPNTKIREMVGTKCIHHHIQQQRIKWFGHLTRLPIPTPSSNVHITQDSVAAKQEDPPPPPPKTWINGVKETTISV